MKIAEIGLPVLGARVCTRVQRLPAVTKNAPDFTAFSNTTVPARRRPCQIPAAANHLRNRVRHWRSPDVRSLRPVNRFLADGMGASCRRSILNPANGDWHVPATALAGHCDVAYKRPFAASRLKRNSRAGGFAMDGRCRTRINPRRCWRARGNVIWLALLLLGREFIQRRWLLLGVIGLIWAALGPPH
jgi:hypothetical protein